MTAPLLITHPRSFDAEREYALNFAFEFYLGIPFRTRVADSPNVTIELDPSCSAGQGRQLLMPDVLFQTAPSRWRSAESLPDGPLLRWRPPPPLQGFSPTHQSLPVVYGRRKAPLWRWDPETGGELGIDVVGSIFFMLSRYEETASSDRDAHGRFAASQSLACREGFLDRPLVNEYLELLWRVIRCVWPALERRRRPSAQVFLSHDVDYPTSFERATSASVLRSCAGDLVKRRDAAAACRRAAAFTLRGSIGRRLDPYNTFDLLMSCSEAAGVASEFYFIPESGAHPHDSNYEIDSPAIRGLLRSIHRRGHRIGYHASYATLGQPDRLAREFGALRRVADEEGVTPLAWAGRQHYLRWNPRSTWQHWDDAGLDVDSSVGFADAAGFRTGYCGEHPVFSHATERQLELTERPLIAMDQTFTHYQRLPWSSIYEKIQSLYQTTCFYGGDFSLLWHNSSLVSASSRRWYRRITNSLRNHSGARAA